MILKREYFYQKVENGLNRFTILGVPSNELQETYFKHYLRNVDRFCNIPADMLDFTWKL